MFSLGARCLASMTVLVGTVAACAAPNPEFDLAMRDGAPGPAGGSGGSGAPADVGTPAFDADAYRPPGPDLLTGLIGYWRMDGELDDGTAPDSSGLHHDGTLEMMGTGNHWVQGYRGNALQFNEGEKNAGVRVGLTKRISDISKFTVAAWVKRTRLRPAGYQSIISRQLGSEIAEVFDMSVSLDRLQTYAPDRTSAGVTAVSVPRTAPVNVWFHAAATYDGGTLTIYQNGVRENSVAWTRGLPSSTNPLYLGTNKNAAGNSDIHHPWEGQLDEVLLYDIDLPPEAIVALAGGMRPPVPDP